MQMESNRKSFSKPASVPRFERVLCREHVAGRPLLPDAPQPAGPLRWSPWPLPRPTARCPRIPRSHPPGRQLSLSPLAPRVSSSHHRLLPAHLPSQPLPQGQLGRLCGPVLTSRPRLALGQAGRPRLPLLFLLPSPASACLAVAMTSYLVSASS